MDAPVATPLAFLLLKNVRERDLASVCFTGAGWNVAAAASEGEALDIARHIHGPCFFLCDFVVGRRSGPAFARDLFRLRDDVRFVFLYDPLVYVPEEARGPYRSDDILVAPLTRRNLLRIADAQLKKFTAPIPDRQFIEFAAST
jgi:hypothetical protein